MAAKTTKIMIVQHDGQKFETEVENYNAQELNKSLTEQTRTTVAIGDLIISPSSISRVIPIKE